MVTAPALSLGFLVANVPLVARSRLQFSRSTRTTLAVALAHVATGRNHHSCSRRCRAATRALVEYNPVAPGAGGRDACGASDRAAADRHWFLSFGRVLAAPRAWELVARTDRSFTRVLVHRTRDRIGVLLASIRGAAVPGGVAWGPT